MTIISPSILSCDFMNIEKELKYFNEIENFWFHLDIMDGHFVPNLTFGHPIIKKISKITSHTLDAHLMVSNPDFYVETLKDFGLYNLTFHLEAMKDTKEAIKLINSAKTDYKSVGISIKPNTAVSDISDEILKLVDLLLIMSVEPGFGGQSFIDNSYAKIEALKERRESLNATFQIQVDGGVSNKNAGKLISSGADNLVAGSYIFKANQSEYKNMVETLR